MKFSDDELLSIIDREEGTSYGVQSGTLQRQRKQALEYYLGETYGNEVEDRSQHVTREVLDTIEWILPSLLKVFMSGDQVVSFDPRNANDIEQSEQETEYVNFVFQQKNPAFQIMYTWFKDALLSKTGYVKVFWEVKTDYQDQRYEGLTQDELAFLLADKEIEILEQEQGIDSIGNPCWAVKIRQVVPCKQVRVVNIPPEDLLVSTKNRSVDVNNATFVQHRYPMTISELRDQGYDIDMQKMGVDQYTDAPERDIYDETGFWTEDVAEEASRTVLVRDSYIRIDDDGDGIAELKRILIAGVQVLEREECDFIPIAAICPVPMPHRHIGLSYADLMLDLQLLKSTITRQIIDNMYLANNVRTAIDDSRVNLDDLLVPRPGGVVRTKGDPAGAIMPLVNPPIAGQSISLLQYIDEEGQNRTGITKYNQGLDANSLNKTASGISQIMSASQQRIELVARLFAETGVKQLFLMIHALICKHADNVEEFKLRDKFVSIDPRSWQKRQDMTIAVGLGTGNKDQMLQHIMVILQAQEKAFPIGVASRKNIYNALMKLTQNAGFKDGESLWTDPDATNTPPHIDPQTQQMIEQGKKMIADLQQELGQTKQQLAQAQLAKVADQSKLAQTDNMEKAQLTLETLKEKAAQEAQQREEDLKRYQIDMDYRKAIEVAEISKGVTLELEQMRAAAPDPAQAEQFASIVEDLKQHINDTQVVAVKPVRDANNRLIGATRVHANGQETQIPLQ